MSYVKAAINSIASLVTDSSLKRPNSEEHSLLASVMRPEPQGDPRQPYERNGYAGGRQDERTNSTQGGSRRTTEPDARDAQFSSGSRHQTTQSETRKFSYAQVTSSSTSASAYAQKTASKSTFSSSSSKHAEGNYHLRDRGQFVAPSTHRVNGHTPESAPQKPVQARTQDRTQDINEGQEEHAVYRDHVAQHQGSQDTRRQGAETKHFSKSEEVTLLRDELRRKDRALAELERRLRAAEEDLKSNQSKMANYKENIKGLEEVLQSNHEAYQQLEHRFMEVEGELVKTQKQREIDINHHSQAARAANQRAEDLQRQVNMMQEHLDQNKKLLSERTDELKMVENYVSKTNGLSGRELTEMVETLNQEISQTSATIIDSLDFKDPSRRKLTEEERAQILPQLEGHLPKTFLFRLARHRPISDDAEEDLGVQIALQAVMAEYACYYVQSWCPSNGDVARFLHSVYEGLRKSDPFTAPRWRSMTHSQVRQQMSGEATQVIDSTLRGCLTLLLNACGWTDDYIASNERHSEAISRGLEVITEKILQLNKAIFEDLMQDEVRLIWFRSESEFVPDLAADDFSGVQQIYGRILCTTDLGVQIITPRTSGDVVATTLKSKVILNDILYKNYQNAGEAKKEKRKHGEL